jgi:hypothetical protein
VRGDKTASAAYTTQLGRRQGLEVSSATIGEEQPDAENIIFKFK